jgi:hypothetical protein
VKVSVLGFCRGKSPWWGFCRGESPYAVAMDEPVKPKPVGRPRKPPSERAVLLPVYVPAGVLARAIAVAGDQERLIKRLVGGVVKLAEQAPPNPVPLVEVLREIEDPAPATEDPSEGCLHRHKTQTRDRGYRCVDCGADLAPQNPLTP